MNKVERLIKLRGKCKNNFIKRIISNKIRKYGLDIPLGVKIGENVRFVHSGLGTVLHETTIIEDNVMIMQNVTIGRADIWKDYSKTKMKGTHVKKGAVLCAGAKIMCKEGILTIGENTIIGANAVLTKSTGDNEIWAGIPAKKIGERKDI